MEITLKTNNESSLAKIIALAKKLNVTIEEKSPAIDNITKKEILKERILNFKTNTPSSFPNPAQWQQEERNNRDLPFSK